MSLLSAASTLVLSNILCIVAARSAGAFGSPANGSRVSGPLSEIPFEIVCGHIFLKVRVNGSTPLWFILDSGNPVAVLDMPRAKEMNIELHGEIPVSGAGESSPKGAFVKGASYTIPGLDRFSGNITLAIPLDILKPHLGHEVDGLLGADFIRRYVVEVDYLSSVIRLYDRETFKYRGPGESVPITFNAGGHPIIHAELLQPGRDPIAGTFVIDLGSGGPLLLTRPFVEQSHLLPPAQKTIAMRVGGGIGGEVGVLVGRVSALKIGGLSVENPLTFFSTDTKGVLASTTFFQGNIGYLILRKFKVVLDYREKRMILEPNSRLKDPIEFVAGFSLVTDEADYGRVRVDQIIHESPAAQAGLRGGDIISAIDGKPASGFSLSQLDEMFEHPGGHTLEVVRRSDTGQETITVKFKLYSLI